MPYRFFPRPRPAAPRGEANPVADKESWQPFSAAAVEQYRAQGRPVFVDFTASWCLSCQVNERVVLDRPDVQQRLRDSGIVLMRADWTHHDEEIAQALTALGRSGVPTYVLYAPGAPAADSSRGAHPGIVFDAIDSLHVPLKSDAKPGTQS